MKKRYFSLLLLPLIWFFLPQGELFNCDYSRAVLSRNGELLRVSLTEDEQFRFPPSDTALPEKYITALLTFEDRRFYYHPGVDLFSIVKSFLINRRAGEIKRGGSTITMQLARLSNPRERTYSAKVAELFRALKITLHYSKSEVLRIYAAHIPMGGNIVGVEAASFRYFGKPPADLTWAEAALLAVLPNAPGMIDLSRKRELLRDKRNRLLRTLMERGELDHMEYALAVDEPLPEKVSRIPFEAPHFTRFMLRSSDDNIIHTTLDRSLQAVLEDEVRRYQYRLSGSGIANSAVLIAGRSTGEVLAYSGSQDYYDEASQGKVDGIQAKRSPGSLLKPFLTAAVLDQGPFTPKSLIQDVPTFFGTFAPQNASRKFDGVVPLDRALVRSLNVPFVRLLNFYGTEPFHSLLTRGGAEFAHGANHYGLSLILGGAEMSLWELSRLYLTIANDGTTMPLKTLRNDSGEGRVDTLFSPGAAALTRTILTELTRPGFEQYRNNFSSQRGDIAWKTGTSYGQKDGWAIGFSGDYLIAVWVGNFTGEGNPAIGGAQTAAPLLFSLFNSLPEKDSLPPLPLNSLEEYKICSESGFLSGENCPESVAQLLPLNRIYTRRCPFHRVIPVDTVQKRSLCSSCWSGVDRKEDTLFILPPAARNFRHQRGYEVDTIPSHREECRAQKRESSLELIYPTEGIRIFLPRNFDGSREKLILSAAHRREGAELFWYLDQKFIGSTRSENSLKLDSIGVGKHRLFVQDSEGSRAEVQFEVFWKE